MNEAEKFKWSIKALENDSQTPVIYFSALPCVEKMLALVEKREEEEILLESKATLLLSKAYIMAIFDCGKVPSISSEIKKIKDSLDHSNMTISRCLVKSLLAPQRTGDIALLVFEQYELKPLMDEAREINQELITNHNYTKYAAAIDMFELSLCNYFLNNDQFG